MLESSKCRQMMWDFTTHIRHMSLVNLTYISGTSPRVTLAKEKKKKNKRSDSVKKEDRLSNQMRLSITYFRLWMQKLLFKQVF